MRHVTYMNGRASQICGWNNSRVAAEPMMALIRTFLTYRVAKTHRIPYLYRSFSAKVTYN